MIQATPGYALCEADYVGAELFMMAIQSGAQKMIDHCLRANLPDGHPDKYDIHSAIAVKAFGLNCRPSKKGLAEAGLPHIRDVTKTIVFGIPYGRGDAAVVRAVEEEGTQISADDAAVIRAAVLEEYAELGPYFEACQRRVHRPGGMRNCYGRYRRFPRLRAGGDDGGASEREAGNFPIQSGVADAISRALDHFYNWPGRDDAAGPRFRIVLYIHDAILFEVRLDCLGWFLGTPDNQGVVGACMTDKVVVKACDLDGRARPGIEPYHMGTEASVYLHWGEKFSRDEGLAWGVPEPYLPKPKAA
jgi:DNA polymerase I-like protein with 3'-5' exonuclease and polymerase domains